MDLIQYPKRPRFFALRFCRLITKVCLANQIGPSAFTLLTIIVHTEDAAGYRHAITFFNGQLAPLIGASSVDTLVRARRKAVEAGWLHYEEGGKGVAGRYWVVIPTRYEHVDDAPTCEMDGEYTGDLLPRKSEDKPKGSRREAESKRGRYRFCPYRGFPCTYSCSYRTGRHKPGCDPGKRIRARLQGLAHAIE